MQGICKDAYSLKPQRRIAAVLYSRAHAVPTQQMGV